MKRATNNSTIFDNYNYEGVKNGTSIIHAGR